MTETALASRLDDTLYALHAGSEAPSYPRSARDYLDAWAAPEHGWLRKFYPAGADTQPASRLAELHRRRAALDAEVAEAEQGRIRPMNAVALRERYQLFASTARDLLSDFREVEDNFRRLDRAARERIACGPCAADSGR